MVISQPQRRRTTLRATRLVRLVAALAVVALGVSGTAGCGAGGSSSATSGTANNGAPAAKGGGPGGPGVAAPNAGGDVGVPGAPGRRDVSPEVSTDDQPISTFAVDVDTASYGYARRQLVDGTRPDRGTIRPEEFVNAFRQDYRQPAGDGFAISADGARLPDTHRIAGAGQSRLVRIGLRTRAEAAAERKDAVLTFVVDVSGSMSEPGKLDLVQDALRTLIDQLRSTDAVAVVAYSDRANVVRAMTPASNRTALRTAVDGLRIAGSTNLEAGLRLGYDVARKGFRAGATNRVILLSDGLPNVGNTGADTIVREIQEAAAKQIALLGVGVGSDYGDAFMESLADKGDGFVVYVSEREQARRVFVEQLPATLAVRALDAKAQVRFDPATVASYRLIGYDNRALDASAFRNDRVDGGEVGPGHTVTALYLVRLRANGSGNGDGNGGGSPATGAQAAEVRVRWLDPANRTASEIGATVSVGDLQRGFDAAAPRLRVCYAAAYFAEVLRDSAYGHEVRLADLAGIATGAANVTEDRDVAELADLIRRAGRLLG